MEHSEGPRPLTILLILIGCLLLMGALFAALRVFVLEQPAQVQQDNGSIEVAFCHGGSCEDILLRELHAPHPSCAFYELNLNRTIAALAANDARVLLFDEEAGGVQGLAYEPVPSAGLMHHKFCVLGDTVVTGSMNPTMNDAYRNDNNLLVIRSRLIAAEYRSEFDDLADRVAGSEDNDPPQPLIVNLSGAVVELRFCPEDRCEHAVIEEIGAAESSIRFMTFSFTADPIGNALLDMHGRGVDVQGIFERRQNDQWSEHGRMEEAGVPVLLDGTAATVRKPAPAGEDYSCAPGILHHKVFIIDNRTVITGSYNPTKSADERNDENLLIIHDPGIAKQYLGEFNRIWWCAGG